MVDVETLKNCPECGSENIVHDTKNDSVICKDCGAEFAELQPETEEKFEKASDVI